MKSLLVVALCGVLMCLVGVGVVEAATATWVNDTVADFAGTNIYRAPGACATPGAFAKVDTELKPSTSSLLPNPATDGVYCYKATAFDTANNESVFSNTAEFNHNVVPPKAPGMFSVAP